MLKSWSIENFKSIVNSGELQLAPVTVLAGLNSSGKSSLLQSILMVSQTLRNPVSDRSLLPTGPIVQLGTFDDILNEDATSRNIMIGFNIDSDTDIQSRYFLHDVRPDAWYIKVIVYFTSANDKQASSSAVEASNVTIKNVLLEIAYAKEKDKKINLSINKLKSDDLKVFLKDIKPEDLRVTVDTSNQSYYICTINDYNIEEVETCLVSLFHFLPTQLFGKYIVERLIQGISEKNVYSLIRRKSDFLPNINQITRFLTSKIRYLGPLRADPQASQKFAPSSELDDVGAKGEYAAAVYDANQNARIDWYNPFSAQVEKGTLKVALDSWVHYLGVAHRINIESARYSGFSWQVVHHQGHKPLPLSAVGVGVSQILPILVMGLLSPRNALLIIEQPELHLHPRVQARLGDFFMGLAKCNKQCLIETHSENLVNQLRYHIVQAGGQEKSDCMIYFVDQDEKGATQFAPVEISAQGNILNWPDGFFDETMLQEDRITAASLKKRANKGEKQGA